MSRLPHPRGITAVSLLFGILLGGKLPDHAGDDSRGSNRAATAAGSVARQSGNIPVWIHITGLLLIIPPKTENGVTHVVVPASGASDHRAWLAFGIPANTPYEKELCEGGYGDEALDKGICYVNLRDWDLAMIGTGGTPHDDLEGFGVINVKRGSGGISDVDLATSREILLGGGEARQGCALAVWKFKPHGAGTAETRELANVVHWELHVPQSPAFELVFTKGTTTLHVNPVARPDGRIDLVLFNVPDTELSQMPPGQAGSSLQIPTKQQIRKHFDVHYDQLRHPSPPDSNHRHYPKFLAPTNRLCGVQVSTRFPLVAPLERGIGTLGCMPATSDEYP